MRAAPGMLTSLLLILAATAADAASPAPPPASAPSPLAAEVQDAMLRATRFMRENVSTQGGYLWHYLPDMSRRWGEMEAYPTQIWVQAPGTVSMGHCFLDAYHATGDETYYEAAAAAAGAIIWGQLPCGGWNYIIEFAGDRSLRQWYDTIGRNGWGLEEFHHYLGNATFDDDVSSDAARFLLRMYLEKMDPRFKPALDKAIDFILESQYPIGGWPQRYPVKTGKGTEYTAYHTFNDDVVWENVHFLIQCYQTLGEERLLGPIYRGMNFYLVTQQPNPQAGWAQQYTVDTLEPAGARTYEPKALLPGYTAAHAGLLMEFYRLTGQRKFIERVPDALDWLDRCRLPESMTEGGTKTHSTFVEIGTDDPLFVHRRGSNVVHGEYYVDKRDVLPVTHYGAKTSIDIAALRAEYEKLAALSPEEASAGSPLLPGRHAGPATPQRDVALTSGFIMASGIKGPGTAPAEDDVRKVLAALDSDGRWLERGPRVSNPYTGAEGSAEPTDQYASTYVGDASDISPYRDETSDQKFITTTAYIRNMRLLIAWLGGPER